MIQTPSPKHSLIDERRQRFGKAGRDMAADRFNWTSVVDRMAHHIGSFVPTSV